MVRNKYQRMSRKELDTAVAKYRASKPKVMKRKPLVKLIKNVATRVANAGLETKYVAETIQNQAFNSSISSATELYSCYPKLGAGTATFERVGIDVTPMRVKNTWVVSLSPVSRSVNVFVDLFLMIDKNNRFYPQIAGGPSPPLLLRTGNAGVTGSGTGPYNGNNTDSFRMINKERYTLLKHFRFQLASNVGLANGDTTASHAPNVALSSAKTISYVVDTPKQLRYDPGETNPTYPNGHAPFWCLGYSKVDGSAPDQNLSSINVSHISEMIYKDA